LNRLADDSPERQIPWLPGERIELALDSRTGAVTSPTIGEDVLTVTTHRAIRLGRAGGARITEIIPLDRVVHIEVDDVSRDSGRLVKGLIFVFVGAVVGWVIHALFAVTLITLLAGGIPTLVAVFLISGYLFPDEEGAFVLYTAGSVLRHPLLTTESKRDAYLVAHRIYELMTGPEPVRGTSPQPENVDPVPHPSTNGASAASVGDPSGSPAASELASVLRLAFEPTDETMTAEDAAEHIAQSVSAITAATSYVTRQLVRDPEREQMGEGDYVWDLEFVAPDAYRVSQTGWSSVGEVRERWLTVGDDFYLDSQGWQRLLDSARFEEELALNKNLAVNKYITILKQGFPSLYDIVVASGHRYLHLGYQPMTRESLSAVLGNPSPMQGVGAMANLWVELDTHLLRKAEIAIIDARNGQQALFLQSFASYNAVVGVVRPDAPHSASAPSAY
jgi:hypothetical protein